MFTDIDFRVPCIILLRELWRVRADDYVLLLLGRTCVRENVDRVGWYLRASSCLIRYTTSWPVSGVLK